jgi:hypothetical protein
MSHGGQKPILNGSDCDRVQLEMPCFWMKTFVFIFWNKTLLFRNRSIPFLSVVYFMPLIVLSINSETTTVPRLSTLQSKSPLCPTLLSTFHLFTAVTWNGSEILFRPGISEFLLDGKLLGHHPCLSVGYCVIWTQNATQIYCVFCSCYYLFGQTWNGRGVRDYK